MTQADVIFVAEIDHFLQLKRSSIVCDYLPGNPKSGQYVLRQELYDHCIGGSSSWHGLDPFGEVVGDSQDPFLLPRGRWVYLSDDV